MPCNKDSWLGGLTRYFNDVFQGVVASSLSRCKRTKYFYDSVTLDKTEKLTRTSIGFPISIRSSFTFQEKLLFPFLLVTRIGKREFNWKQNRKICESFPFFPSNHLLIIIHSQISLKIVEFSLPPHFSSFLEWWAFCCPFSSPQIWQFFNFLYTLENERSSILENPLILSHQEKQIFALLRPLKTLRWMVN